LRSSGWYSCSMRVSACHTDVKRALCMKLRRTDLTRVRVIPIGERAERVGEAECR